MKVLLVDEAQMPRRLDEKIRAGMCLCFPSDVAVFSKTRAWHGSVPEYCVVLDQPNEVVAHVAIVNRTVTVGGMPLRVAGIQSVFVLPAYRGQGLSDQVLKAAMAEAACRKFDYGLLFCLPPLAKIYARCGWQEVGAREVIRMEDSCEMPLPEKNVTMYYPLRDAAFPEGLLHLCGNDW
jgi:predicted N-acetyltransferase YhbS